MDCRFPWWVEFLGCRKRACSYFCDALQLQTWQIKAKCSVCRSARTEESQCCACNVMWWWKHMLQCKKCACTRKKIVFLYQCGWHGDARVVLSLQEGPGFDIPSVLEFGCSPVSSRNSGFLPQSSWRCRFAPWCVCDQLPIDFLPQTPLGHCFCTFMDSLPNLAMSHTSAILNFSYHSVPPMQGGWRLTCAFSKSHGLREPAECCFWVISTKCYNVVRNQNPDTSSTDWCPLLSSNGQTLCKWP